MRPEDRVHSEELLKIYEENVRKLELQQANFGNQTPVHILNELDQARTQVEAIRRQIHPNDAPASPSDDIQFVNQREALNAVLSQPQANNFVIDAPAGYGKTRLLKELAILLMQRDWYVRTISFETSHVKPIGQHEAISFIAGHFELKHAGTAEEMGRKVAERLRRLSSGNPGMNPIGSVLILDSLEQITNGEPGKPYHEIRAFFEGFRKASEFFEKYTVRIILSGRYISPYIATPGDSIVINLRPFDLNIIHQAVDIFLESHGAKMSFERSRDVAQHILYITGGHPDMIKRLLIEEQIGILHNQTTDLKKWMANYTDDIQLKIIKPTIDTIRGDVPNDLWNVLEILCVFRRFNRHIIKQLLPQDITGYKTHFELVDALKQAHLIKHTGSSFEDGVLRPAIVRWLQFFEPDRFLNYCRIASDIFVRQLDEPVEGMTRAYVLRELLYIALLQRYQIVLNDDSTARSESLRDVQAMMRGYIQTLLNRGLDRDGLAELFDDLLNSLRSDNDIVFLFDYIFGTIQSCDDFTRELCDINNFGN